MEEIEYLRLKCKILELNNQEFQLNQAYEKIRISRMNLYKEYGLDPTKNYNMNDVTFELKEVNG